MSTMTVSAGVRYAGGAGLVGAAAAGVAGRRQVPATRPRTVGRCVTRSHPAAQGVRLTRRGRLLVSTLALLVLVAGAVLLSGGAAALAGTEGGGQQPVADRVTVQPGETLWAIAERVAPGADPRETVQEILDLNGLRTAQVQSGTALVVPSR